MTTRAPSLFIPQRDLNLDERFFAPSDKPALDLSRRHFEHEVRHWRVIGTWLRSVRHGEHSQPCLVVLPKNDARARKATPCVVPLNTSWVWAEPPLGDEFQAAMMTRDFLLALGFDPMDDKLVFSLLDTLRGRLGDLIRMPPEPPAPTRVVAEVKLNLSDGRTIESEVRQRA